MKKFSKKFAFNTYAIFNSIENWSGAYKTYYHYIPFDAEFYDNFEFIFKIWIPLTHFEIFAIFKLGFIVSYIISVMICHLKTGNRDFLEYFLVWKGVF